MANVAFSDLAELTSLATTDLFCVTDASESSSEKSKKVEVETLRDYLIITGQYFRPKFTYKDADEIYVNGGFYDVDGKYSEWTSQLTEALAGAVANTWYYLYLDYSGITSGTAITATELAFSSTAPSWNDSKRGWYNGSDRCIFAVRTDSSADIIPFYHQGEMVMFDYAATDRANTDLDTTWTDVTLTIPNFCRRALITPILYSLKNDQEIKLLWRVNGSSNDGHEVADGYSKGSSDPDIRHYNQIQVFTDSNLKIEMRLNYSGSDTVKVTTNGFFLPDGM